MGEVEEGLASRPELEAGAAEGAQRRLEILGIASLDLAAKLANGRTADELVGARMDMIVSGNRNPSAGSDGS